MYEMGVSSPSSLLAMSRVAGTPFGLSLSRTFFLPLLIVSVFIETIQVSAMLAVRQAGRILTARLILQVKHASRYIILSTANIPHDDVADGAFAPHVSRQSQRILVVSELRLPSSSGDAT